MDRIRTRPGPPAPRPSGVSDFRLEGCEQVADLLGVYAVDALDEEEASRVETHVRYCPRCSQEVDGHRETVALLAAVGGPAPEGVWDRIAKAISGDTSPAATRLAPRFMATIRPPVRRRVGWRRPVCAAGLAAAAAVAAVIGVQTSRVDQLNRRVNQLTVAAQQTGGFQGVAAALVDPTARHYTLDSTSSAGQPLGQLLVLPSGASYMVDSRLPALSPASTYQLWSLIAGRAVSVGLLGDHPTAVAFAIDPTVATNAYVITVEPAGGVVTPTTAPVAKATV